MGIPADKPNPLSAKAFVNLAGNEIKKAGEESLLSPKQYDDLKKAYDSIIGGEIGQMSAAKALAEKYPVLVEALDCGYDYEWLKSQYQPGVC